MTLQHTRAEINRLWREAWQMPCSTSAENRARNRTLRRVLEMVPSDLYVEREPEPGEIPDLWPEDLLAATESNPQHG